MPRKHIDHPYEAGDTLFPLTAPLDKQSLIRVLDLGELRFFEEGPTGRREIKSPPDPKQVFIRPRPDTPERQTMRRAANILAAALDRRDNKGFAVAEVADLLNAKKFKKAFIDAAIRAFVATGTLRVSSNNGKQVLKLTQTAREVERRRGYSASFANDLAAQSEQLGRLIRHGSTVGTEREELLRALLERHVPKRYHVATGFVDGFDPQFDILIYDQIDFAPVFRTGNLVVVPSEAVRAVIEVKSTLDATNIDGALTHINGASLVSGSAPPIFRGVFAYEGVKPKTIAKAIRKHHRLFGSSTPIDDYDTREPIVSVAQMATAVCVLGKSMVRTGFAKLPPGTEFPWMPVTVTVNSDADHSSQAAAFFDLLDRFLRYPYEGSFERSSLVDVVRDDMLASDVAAIYSSEEWAQAFLLDDDGAIMSDRISAYQDWLRGEAWRSQGPELEF